MTRWKAGTVHLTISLIVASIVGALVYFVWFPQPYFLASGASSLIVILMGVDVGIGPLLTTIVFSTKKPRRVMRQDLAIIALLQVIAFAYGASVIWQARPAFVVGEVDRLVLVSASSIDAQDMAKASLPAARNLSWRGPRLVGTVPPSGPDAFDIIASAMKGGKDIDNLPQFFVAYEEVVPALLHHAPPIGGLHGLSSGQQRQLARSRAKAHSQGHELAFLPLEHGDSFYTAIVRADNAVPILVLKLDPWESGNLVKQQHPSSR